nr:helix-turn-helix transcriptional regulator [Clostridium estertheticum]
MQIKLKSRGDYEISEGTLYLALKRLETNEYVQSYLLIFNNS